MYNKFWLCIGGVANDGASTSSQNQGVKMNKVAPVVIKSCKEEFQRYYAKKDKLVTGRITNEYAPHALLLVSYHKTSAARNSLKL